jgi:hypothetical protein
MSKIKFGYCPECKRETAQRDIEFSAIDKAAPSVVEASSFRYEGKLCLNCGMIFRLKGAWECVGKLK